MTAETQEVETTGVALVPTAGGSLVRQAAPTAEIVEAQTAYHDLCAALLDRASDYQRIGTRDFPKKSAWRKLAVAFNVSTHIVDRVYERDERGRIVRAEVVAIATAPNGRTMDGLGACDVTEKCCVAADGEECTIQRDRHRHCPLGCTGRAHFSNPSHDLPSTAHTRAVNRACADLFGMGEVSAEEMNAHRAAAATDDHECEPPPDPYPLFGWESSEEHHAQREIIVNLLKTLPDEARAQFKVWAEANGIEWKRAHSKGESDAMLAAVEKLVERHEEPAEDPPVEVAPATPAELGGVISDRLERIITSVDTLSAEQVELALVGRKIEPGASETESRQRLAAAIYSEPEAEDPF